MPWLNRQFTSRLFSWHPILPTECPLLAVKSGSRNHVLITVHNSQWAGDSRVCCNYLFLPCPLTEVLLHLLRPPQWYQAVKIEQWHKTAASYVSVKDMLYVVKNQGANVDRFLAHCTEFAMGPPQNHIQCRSWPQSARLLKRPLWATLSLWLWCPCPWV